MKRSVIFLALAGLAAVLASVVVYSALKRRDAMVQQAISKTVYIVVAATDLPLGTKIDASQLNMARWSADAIPPGAVTTPQQVIGSFVKNEFVMNEPIVESKLFNGEKTAGVLPLLIPPGMRAVSVPVDEVSDIAGFVLPHTHVDILVALEGENNKSFSKIVLQDVEVLAIAQEVEGKKDAPELVKVVTVLVTPQNAERLALACREGTLRLAMRNYTDSKIVLTNGSDLSSMLHAYDNPAPPVMASQHRIEPIHQIQKMQLEIYRNGKTSESVSFVRQALADRSSYGAGPDISSRKPHRDSFADSIWNSERAAEPEPGTSSNSPAPPPTKTATDAPASAPAGTPSFVPEVSTAGFAPHSKTIDFQWGSDR